MSTVKVEDSTVPFSFFTSLLNELSVISHDDNQAPSHQQPSALRLFIRWAEELKRRFKPLPCGTTASVFRLLFPEHDTRRKYGIQEGLLASLLADCIGVTDEELQSWNSAKASGCLGLELRRMLLTRSNWEEDHGLLSIADVDELLNELASTSNYSHISLRQMHPVPRGRQDILRLLYNSLSPRDISFVAQIILKDLRPLIYPLSDATTILSSRTLPAFRILRIEDAMCAWDPSGRLLKGYRLRSKIDDVNVGEAADIGHGSMPYIGNFIEIPKCKKGRGCLDALSYMRNSKRVWAEIKYDGERAQIHVEMVSETESKITIFSKSKRDSTQDRIAIHSMIRLAIGLHESNSERLMKPRQNIVLDAEMVACNGNDIDEFWRIRGLLEDSFIYNPPTMCGTPNTQSGRHLGLVFFDILVLDSQPIIYLPYSRRRQLLESVIKVLPGHIYLAERIPIDLAAEHPECALQMILSHSIANFEEGIVLKAEESLYLDYNLPWVKLKRDYIPGYGDTIDLVLLGAGWDKERGRELRVVPDIFTTFFVGSLMNATEMKADTGLKPHFYLSTAVSYGMTREQLGELNFMLKNSDTTPYDQFLKSSNSFDHKITLCTSLRIIPSIILRTPLLAELFGAGFTKPKGGEHYELRFPRITRVYHQGERNWTDSVDFQHLQKLAYSCVGQDSPLKDLDDWCNSLWGKGMSASVRSRLKRKASAAALQDKLEILDNKLSIARYQPVARRRRKDAFYSIPTGLTHVKKCREDRLEMPPQPATYSGFKDLVSLLGTSVVWFSGENRFISPWHSLVMPGYGVHTLESLLIGCRWPLISQHVHMGPWMHGVVCGVAIVHDDKWKKFALETMVKCKAEADMNDPDCKPVFLIDASSRDIMSIVYKLDSKHGEVLD